MESKSVMNIAVMGVTGSGKSTFIHVASQLPIVGIGNSLHSCKVASHGSQRFADANAVQRHRDRQSI